jgi:site-specific recombinase XerD
VKGVKKLGARLGNWLTADEARRFWQAPPCDTLKGKLDRAILAVLLGCGLRRQGVGRFGIHAFVAARGTLAIVDLIGKGGHIRTVPVPDWVKTTVDIFTSLLNARWRVFPQAAVRRPDQQGVNYHDRADPNLLHSLPWRTVPNPRPSASGYVTLWSLQSQSS